ncbi:hypothetical protein EDM80_04370 [bacterium]|nr:MAG: hypothetical protein EDM80_04370 [bacterium]RIK61599.1 MAG: hypothetical protein DCC64_12845 [Planctomycetota bacterium]
MSDDEREQARQHLRQAEELRARMAAELRAEQARAEAETSDLDEEDAEEADAGDSAPGHDRSTDTRILSPEAKLTHLPVIWALLTILLCMSLSYLVNQVDGERMRQALRFAQDKGELSQDDADLAEKGISTFEQRERYQKKLRELRAKRRELADRTRHLLEGSEHHDDEEQTRLDKLADMPLTLEAFRDWLQQKAGPDWDRWRNSATAVALVIGGLGLVVAAFMVRIAGALALGLVGAVSGFAIGGDVMWVAGLGLLGAIIGMILAPRLLLASIYSNAMLAGIVVGGLAAGGATYLGTQSEGLGLAGLGLGALFGAMVALKFGRQFYLCSVLANTAGLASFILLLVWGEAFPYFSQVTFGGLMLADGLLTRLYHKIRYS